MCVKMRRSNACVAQRRGGTGGTGEEQEGERRAGENPHLVRITPKCECCRREARLPGRPEANTAVVSASFAACLLTTAFALSSSSEGRGSATHPNPPVIKTYFIFYFLLIFEINREEGKYSRRGFQTF